MFVSPDLNIAIRKHVQHSEKPTFSVTLCFFISFIFLILAHEMSPVCLRMRHLIIQNQIKNVKNSKLELQSGIKKTHDRCGERVTSIHWSGRKGKLHYIFQVRVIKKNPDITETIKDELPSVSCSRGTKKANLADQDRGTQILSIRLSHRKGARKKEMSRSNR